MNALESGRLRGRRIAVFGATGRTGRFVVAELGRRGWPTIVARRDRVRLEAVALMHAPESLVRVARVDAPASLDDALAGAGAVINCAGPFLDTAPAVLDAAIRAGIHYVDVTAEQAAAARTLESYAKAAAEVGVVVVPAVGFYGGLADLLATAMLGDWPACDEILVAVALDSWHPTPGTRLTGERNTIPRVIYTEGELQPAGDNAAERSWDFPPPFGSQPVVLVPLSEIITANRHRDGGRALRRDHISGRVGPRGHHDLASRHTTAGRCPTGHPLRRSPCLPERARQAGGRERVRTGCPLSRDRSTIASRDG